MTPDETKQVLAKAALVDNRTVDLATIRVWHEAIGHLDYRTALAALDRHRATSTEYLVPAHINEHAKLVRQQLAHDEAAERARYALPAPVPVTGGVPSWVWHQAGVNRSKPQPPAWPCPWCGARELEPCTNRGTRRPFHGIHPARQNPPTGATA